MRQSWLNTAELRSLGVNPRLGLTSGEVRERLARYGLNLLTPPSIGQNWLGFLRPFRDPMVLLLLGAGLVYFLLGDVFNAVVMLVAVVPIAAVDLVLEIRAERALDQLRKLSAPHADVKREGRWVRVSASQVVPGDVVRVQEGAVVPADGIVITAADLQVDESSVTGESQPVAKEGVGWPPSLTKSEEVMLLAGTTVLSGRGEMAVVRTGRETVQGEIGQLVGAAKPTRTATQRAIDQLATYLGIEAGVLVLAVVVVLFLRGASLGDALIAGISLAIAAIPEEFAIVFALFLALGARYLATRNALVRRLAAIETLGTVNVIATDKTGTLTLGQLSVAGLYADGKVLSAAEPVTSQAVRTLVEAATLASEPNPFDPLERAIIAYASRAGVDLPKLYGQWDLVHEYRFESERRYMSHIWRASDGRQRLCAKGGVEAILAISRVDESERQLISAANEQLAGQGMRVIAIGQRFLSEITGERSADESELTILGLIGLSDPPRPGAKEAVEESQRAGIRVLMVTGDHPLTAHAIAEAVGLTHDDGQVVTGSDIERFTPERLRQAVLSSNIFARVLPAQKYRLVQMLKAMKNTVAVTGDGVNDAPALREADIGIAMGQRGTDVARSAAAMVLLDDNFLTIVDAVRQGRRIFGNLQKAFRYLLAYHVPIVFSALVVPLIGFPLLLMPITLVWLELIVHPTAALVFLAEPSDPGIMRSPPRKPESPFLTRFEVIQVITAGLGLLVITVGVYIFNIAAGQPAPVARTLALAVLILGNAALAEIERSGSTSAQLKSIGSNRVAAIVLSLAVASFVPIVYIPGLAEAFQVEPPPPILWLEPVVLILIWSALTLFLRRLNQARST